MHSLRSMSFPDEQRGFRDTVDQTVSYFGINHCVLLITPDLRSFPFRAPFLCTGPTFSGVWCTMQGHAVAQLVQALCYKMEGSRFESLGRHWRLTMSPL
jgi:hypothetical protein